MLDLLETRCFVWFAICCIAPWRYDWTHLHDRYDKSDFFSSDIISFLSCFRGISVKLSKQYHLKFPDKCFFCSSYSGWVFLGLLTDRGVKMPPVPKICQTNPTMTKLNTAIPYLTNIQNIQKLREIPLSFAGISIFSPKICNFSYIKKYRYRLHFNT